MHKISTTVWLSEKEFRKLEKYTTREHMTTENYITIATNHAIHNDLLNISQRNKT